MSYKKRSGSSILTTARNRIEALRNIDPDISLGGDITINMLTGKADELMNAIFTYNNLLANADGEANRIDELEREVRDFNERIFMGVAAIYGRDSTEYEKVGGVRKSEIPYGPRVRAETFDPNEEPEPSEETDPDSRSGEEASGPESGEEKPEPQSIDEAA